jgi:outer membrane protein OmpA-like peptidoglycan-associated protein
MKNRLKLFFLFLMHVPVLSSGQTFSLTDTVFAKKDILRTSKIQFELALTKLRPESKAFLDSIASFLLMHQELVVEIGVHCDSRWSNQYSTCLTCRRAESIKNYLVEKGVNPELLIAKGYNDSLLLVSDEEIAKASSEEMKEILHSKNHRTEFKIIGIKTDVIPVFDFYAIEVKPEFPGGEEQLLKYIAEGIRYPNIENDCIFHKMIVDIVIDKNGNCSDVRVDIRSCPGYDDFKNHVKQLLMSMPAWTPGEHKGEKVNVKFTIPVNISWR